VETRESKVVVAMVVLMVIGIGCLALLTAIAAAVIVAVRVRSDEETIEREERDVLAAIRKLTQQLNRVERRVDTLNARSRTPYAPRARATSDVRSHTPYRQPVRRPRNYEDEE
jgi:TolA-binding protein